MIEDMPSDILSYVQQIVGSEYDPQMPVEAVKRLSYSRSKRNKELIEGHSYSLGLQPTGIESGKLPAEDPKAVFVVHGRNLKARDELFVFLRAIGLHPLEWSEAKDKTDKTNPYIGEILETAFSKAQAVVVLMTPDDEARLRLPFRTKDEQLHEIELTAQPRQNVLFEAGMAMGRFEHRTILVQLGSVRPFSDIAGCFLIKLDNSVGARNDLIARLKKAKCDTDFSGDFWQKAGDFLGALAGDIQGADAVDWMKPGAIWWMCSDTIQTINWIAGGASKEIIVDGLKRTHNHADQLHLGDVIVGRLQQLKDEAMASNDGDWTPQKREAVTLELRRIFNSVGQLAIEHQKTNHPEGFKSDPD